MEVLHRLVISMEELRESTKKCVEAFWGLRNMLKLFDEDHEISAVCVGRASTFCKIRSGLLDSFGSVGGLRRLEGQ